MTWLNLVLLVIELLAKRGGGIGPLLAQGFARLRPHVPDGDVPPGVLAAPEELTRALTDFLHGLIDKAGVGPVLRLVLRRAVDVLPAVIDQVWDRLFERGVVGPRPFGATAFGGAGEPEDAEMAAAVSAELAAA